MLFYPHSNKTVREDSHWKGACFYNWWSVAESLMRTKLLISIDSLLSLGWSPFNSIATLRTRYFEFGSILKHWLYFSFNIEVTNCRLRYVNTFLRHRGCRMPKTYTSIYGCSHLKGVLRRESVTREWKGSPGGPRISVVYSTTQR